MRLFFHRTISNFLNLNKINKINYANVSKLHEYCTVPAGASPTGRPTHGAKQPKTFLSNNVNDARSRVVCMVFFKSKYDVENSCFLICYEQTYK